ncbi:YolD-like family protein [Paenibacillus swuensis]|uniref:YolD-like family protein n=1 Tax=Paenibacillus swuensis TaxID=1178515 RepID=UPI0008397A68|nr:YolD-like family protein [Paenibacillus swuensis]
MKPKINKLTTGRNLLWESSRMMLPEHKEQILRHRSKLEDKIRPALDEQRLQELSQAIADAVMHALPIAVTLYDPLESRIVQGSVVKIDPLARELHLRHGETKIVVALEEVLDITLAP